MYGMVDTGILFVDLKRRKMTHWDEDDGAKLITFVILLIAFIIIIIVGL